MLIGDRLKSLREEKESFAGRHRTAHRALALLRVARRERPHRSGGRDSGKVCAGVGCADVPIILRRHEQTAGGSDASNCGLGQHREGCPGAESFPATPAADQSG